MRISPLISAALVLLLAGAALAADPATEAARRLASQVAAKAGAGSAVALTVDNRSSMPPGVFADLKRTLTAEFWAQGLPAVDPSRAVAEVKVTLSENLRGYLLVAAIREGQNQDVAMVPMERSTPPGAAVGSTALVLRKTPLWSQDTPILDAALLQTGGSSHLLVLDTRQIALYALRDDGSGAVESSQAIAAPPAGWSRDPRGRVVLRRDHLFDIYLPGMICSSGGQGVPGTQCHASDDPWPLDSGEGTLNGFFASTRNFFNGTLTGPAAGGQDVGPFFSAALISGATFFTGVDGRVRVLASGAAAPLDLGWGSTIAALNSGCGSGWQVLATAPGDFSSSDSVQAYDVSGREAAAISQKVEFAGPVTALWTAADRASVLAVSHNLTTGRYEAAILTIACSR